MHGLLHLLGYDHEAGAEEAAAMERAERVILGRLAWQAQPCHHPYFELSAKIIQGLKAVSRGWGPSGWL